MPDSALPLSVCLFGSPSLSYAGKAIRPLRTRKGYALFALLALRTGRMVERDFVAGTLWPDSGPEQALAGLRRALTDLRDALGPAAACITAPTARTLQVDVTESMVDVLHFDALLARANGQGEPRRQAVALYRGALMEDCSEEWVLQERRLRETTCYEALLWLANEARRELDFSAAIGYLRRAQSLDPLDEGVCRLLMQTYAESGNPAMMTETYRHLRTYLRHEINTEPAGETSELFQRLRKGVIRPSLAGGVATAPPVAAPTSAPTLPTYLTSFIGREECLRDLVAHFPTTRLITLTGAGGVGKTRLAVEISKRVSGQFSQIRFVDLSPLTDGDLLLPALLKSLAIPEAPGKAPITLLTELLNGDPSLLVLDNCEHLVEAVVALTLKLLAACPSLSILATSRQPLHVIGEHIYRVLPLRLPDSDLPLPPKAALLSDAIQLFIDRARQAKPDFDVSEQNYPMIADICRHLDGLPLTIELAAARLGAVSLAGIASHLDSRLHLFTNDTPLAQPRQRTLRTMLDWSYDLLTTEERQLLRRMAVFVSPVDAGTVHAVCADLWEEEWQTLLTLAHLVEKSLVMFDGENYRLLETIRQYAQEQLGKSGEFEGTLDRHRQHFLLLAEAAEKHWKGVDAAQWGRRLDRVSEDILLALDTCPVDDAATAIRLAMALVPYWLLRGHLSEGRYRLLAIRQRFARTLSQQPEDLIHLLNGLGTLAYRQGDYLEAENYLQEKLQLCRERQDVANIAHTLGNLGNIAFYRGDLDTAEHDYRECLELLRREGNQQGIATALMNLGNIATVREQYRTAEPLLSESLEIWRELDNIQGIANTLHNLGSVAIKQEQYQRAHALLGECLLVRRRLDHRQGIAHTLLNLVGVCLRTGQTEHAPGHVREAWQILTEIGDRLGQAEALRCVAEIEQAQNDSRQAVVLYAAMAVQREELGVLAVPCDQQTVLEELRESLGEEIFTAAWTIGRCTPATALMERRATILAR